ncbi:MAG: hypothetical protein KME04_04365 [Pleurocapsa minor GSE-CHR-MK-17-07R]|jgi:hypothetical protein|nr:hypothetical protein [Pleurocapsa minor GSE-CHR-MK 17-07R]
MLKRFNDELVADDVFTTMAENPLGMLPLVTLKGGGAVMPGQSESIPLIWMLADMCWQISRAIYHTDRPDHSCRLSRSGI